jgi:hypothetical protein
MELDFVVLPLLPHTVQPILDVVLLNRRFMNDIIHIQIEKNDRLEFGSYDNFHPECIVCFLGVGTDLLDALRDKGSFDHGQCRTKGRGAGMDRCEWH